LGCKVDAIVMEQKLRPADAHMSAMRSITNSVRFVERLPLRKCLATITPTFVACNGMLSRVPLSEEYDATIIESEYCLPICENPSLKTHWRVLRLHNDEVAYAREYAGAEERFLRRQFNRLEALRMARYCGSAQRKVDALWFISKAEAQRFIACHPNDAYKAAWLPPAIDFGPKPRRISRPSNNVLFVGNFYSALNREGLRWYLRYVHPLLQKDPRYEFIVAGSTHGREEAHAFVEALRREPRCTVHVNVESTEDLYASSAVFVNPIQAGAGVKVKNIHAIERRIPVVSTGVANEGSGFIDREHLRIADLPEDFACTVKELLSDNSAAGALAGRAHAHLLRHYDCELNLRRQLSLRAGAHCSRPRMVEKAASL
jgi:glycosyltransferase involved in cell wall biosynthesis